MATAAAAGGAFGGAGSEEAAEGAAWPGLPERSMRGCLRSHAAALNSSKLSYDAMAELLLSGSATPAAAAAATGAEGAVWGDGGEASAKGRRLRLVTGGGGPGCASAAIIGNG
jgi:hypothetical protein